MTENTEKQNENAGLPINFRVLPRTPSFYSHRTMLQRGELGEVVITFFEIIPPIVEANSEEDSERLRTLGVNAESQVRIILPSERFLDFARLITKWAIEIVDEKAPAPKSAEGE